MALGLGKPDADTMVFAEPDGSPTPPNRQRRWQDACVSLKLPRASFHALRHTHARALIASKELDIVQISRRLGHTGPNVTLKIYAHLFAPDDRAAGGGHGGGDDGKEK